MNYVRMTLFSSLLSVGLLLGVGERTTQALAVGGGGGETCCLDGTTQCFPCGAGGGGDQGGDGGGGRGGFACYNCRSSGCQSYPYGGTDCSDYDGAGTPGCYLYNPCTSV